MNKKIFMIAGPNGAGKTTTAMSFISSEMIDEFINAEKLPAALPLYTQKACL
jgi:predicted ABC-type ATPase